MARSPDSIRSSVDRVAADEGSAAFQVRVGGFAGPFDLLLDLIGKHELDITEIALSAVTDEFLAHLPTLAGGEDLEQASGFLVVGATLLDLKIAGLLPQGELVDAEGLALLEARDLLFARLLQYRAFKDSTAWFTARLADEAARHPGAGGSDPGRQPVQRPLEWSLDAAGFAALAAMALAPTAPPAVGLEHLHASVVSLREQAATVAALLRGGASRTFLDLAGDVEDRAMVVARFLAVLELYRHGALAFEQLEPLGALVLRWTAADWTEDALTALGRDWDG